jgi:hypothetical protein
VVAEGMSDRIEFLTDFCGPEEAKIYMPTDERLVGRHTHVGTIHATVQKFPHGLRLSEILQPL